MAKKQRCPIDLTVLVADVDGTLSGAGFSCYYCPKCGYILPCTF